jgi:hypothetical protein
MRIESWHLRPYPAELRKRAVRMAAEIRPNHPTQRTAMKVVAAKLGVGRSHNTAGNPSIN